ncbi:MAG: hypothetical protein FJX76_19205 [Armatimonadetes bacterium]|nr:hypothetical protein [Armatimonadota bacterium]
MRVLAMVLVALCVWALPLAAKPSVLDEDQSGAVSPAEKAGVQAVICDLFVAYYNRDVDRVVEIEKGAIESSALAYEKQGKGKADDVRDAFREGARDVLSHKDFAMEPLRLEDVRYKHSKGRIVVSSVVPIIATNKVTLAASGLQVRLSISTLVFEKKGNRFEIVAMQIH